MRAPRKVGILLEFVHFTDFADAMFLLGGDVYKNFMWLYFLIGGICFAIFYVFKAVALFTIARREGYKNRWMAFVPFLNTYYTGVVSDKNKIFGMKARTVSAAAAVFEFIYVAMEILYYTAQWLIFKGGYAIPTYEPTPIGGEYVPLFGGYDITGLPSSLSWAGWVYAYFNEFFLYWLNLLSLISYILVVIAFFQTYSCKYYVVLSLLSAIFPISGILMFAVRNKRGQNYAQYVKERQYRQYRQYQEYMRQNGGFNDRNNNGNPYDSSYGPEPKDPFDGMGENDGDNSSTGGSGNDDPFEDF